jgi:predicted ATP-dependent serine protease
MAYKLSVSTVRLRARKLKIKPMNNQYLFNTTQVNEIVNFSEKTIKLPKIIYVETIYEIRESKLNRMEL